MWLTDIMEIGFGGAMLCLALDLGKKYFANRRQIVIGSVAAIALLVSLIELLANWRASLGTQIEIQPLPSSAFASLYVVNDFSIFVIFTSLIIGTAVTIYSLTCLTPNDNSGPYFALMLLLLTSIVGVASAGDFLTLFLFWEGMSISAYGLVAFYRGSMPLSLEASLKYIFLAGVGSLIALYGISLVYTLVGSIQLSALSTLLSVNSASGILALLFIIFGFGVEAAIFPLHTWLPDVYSAAPVPISAIVSGIVTEIGVFTLVKIIQPLISGPSTIIPNFLSINSAQEVQLVIATLAVFTMFVGNFSGLVQTNLKRILAFSSIAQTGYMMAALSTFSVAGLTAVVFNIWNQGIVKSNFFLLGGLGGRNYEDAELDKLQGLGEQNRIVGVMFGSSSLAMVGSPPFGLFWSEILLVEALLSVSSPIFFVLGVIVVLNIFLSLGYYLKIINRIVFSPPPEGQAGRQKISLGPLIPPMILIALSLLSGILPFIFLNQIT